MSKNEFRELLYDMIKTFGVGAFEVGENDGLWFVCPECGEPILFEDWVDDKELADGCCPICGERWF